MQLLPAINKGKTRENARDVLKQYRKLNRIAGRSPVDLKSPIITDMPKARVAANGPQDAFLEFMDAEAERNAIVAALMALPLISRQVLYYSYCDCDRHTNYEIGILVGHYSDKNIEKLKAIALIEFAEAYKKGKLLKYAIKGA